MRTLICIDNTRYFLYVDYIIKIGNINGRKNTHDNNKKVITQWLYGISRDQIAKANQIGAGTVSAIIKQCKEQKQQEYAAEDVIVLSLYLLQLISPLRFNCNS